MASTTWFVVFNEDSKSSVKGISRFLSCVERRYRMLLVVFLVRKSTSDLIKFVFRLLRVKDRWLIAIMKQVAGCHKPITTFLM